MTNVLALMRMTQTRKNADDAISHNKLLVEITMSLHEQQSA